tara:strand:+ start:46 stop:453 length:408 start_codon:yes stop_codon:yes gene_type:complete
MKKIYIILSLLALSVIWAQKEVPGAGGTLEATGDERLNGKKIQPIDADIVQQVRILKANKEKAFMKKQILSGQKVDKKTFKVSSSESKYLAIKEIINEVRNTKQIKLESHMNSFKKYKDKNSEKIINDNINNNSR